MLREIRKLDGHASHNLFLNVPVWRDYKPWCFANDASAVSKCAADRTDIDQYQPVGRLSANLRNGQACATGLSYSERNGKRCFIRRGAYYARERRSEQQRTAERT